MHIRTRHAVRREHNALARARDDKLYALARASAPDARKVRRTTRATPLWTHGLTFEQRRACAEHMAAAIHDDDDKGDDDGGRDTTMTLRCFVCHVTTEATRVMRKSFEIVNPWARCVACDRSAHARCFVALGAGSTRVHDTAMTCARCALGTDRGCDGGGGGDDDDVRPKRLRFDDDESDGDD